MDISKVIDQLTPVFSTLAEKIGQGGSWIFEIYVRQQFVTAITDTILFVLGIIATIVFVFSVRSMREDDWESSSLTGRGVFMIISGFMAAIFMIIGSISFFVDNAIGHFINPQYYALQELVSDLTGHTNGN